MKARRRVLPRVAGAVAVVLFVAGGMWATGWCIAQVTDAVRDAGP